MRRWPPILAIAAVCLGQPAAGAASPPATAKIPPAEQDYIAMVDTARRAFAASRSVDARAELRMGLQISTHAFMGLTHTAQGWAGTFLGSTKADDGSRSILIELAPGIAISTLDSRYADAPYATMVARDTAMARAVDRLTIGQPVVFSADLLGSVIGDDENMVMHPRIIAVITRLTGMGDEQPGP